MNRTGYVLTSDPEMIKYRGRRDMLVSKVVERETRRRAAVSTSRMTGGARVDVRSSVTAARRQSIDADRTRVRFYER